MKLGREDSALEGARLQLGQIEEVIDHASAPHQLTLDPPDATRAQVWAAERVICGLRRYKE